MWLSCTGPGRRRKQSQREDRHLVHYPKEHWVHLPRQPAESGREWNGSQPGKAAD